MKEQASLVGDEFLAAHLVAFQRKFLPGNQGKNRAKGAMREAPGVQTAYSFSVYRG